MSWLQIHLVTDKEQALLLELLLENLGALSVTLGDAADEPLLEPAPDELPIWQRTRVTGLFPGDADEATLRQVIINSLTKEALPELVFERLEDRTWERAWLDAFHPMRFGERLWICPDGQPPGDPDGVVVELDPGLAFGTGTHPTTSLCLQWLDRNNPQGKRIIDFGCGSGILAIAALKLGAADAVAMDHDPQALQATEENAGKNGVLDRLRIHGKDDVTTEGQADIVLANILAGTLIELEPLLAAKTTSGGWIVLSGILREQGQEVAAAYGDHFAMEAPEALEDWVLLAGRRKSG
jgi:ribosomal protein L11 methyltransferase